MSVRYAVDNVDLSSVIGHEERLETMMNQRADDGWRLVAAPQIGSGGLFPSSAGGVMLIWEGNGSVGGDD